MDPTIWIALGALKILVMVAGVRLSRWALGVAEDLPPSEAFPPVTVIKPVYGADDATGRCFRSWIEQDYPGEVQLVFSLQDAADPAREVLAELADAGDFEVIVNPVLPGHSGKVSNLVHGMARARHDLLVFSDADILATPDTLSRLVGQLERGADVASCAVRTNGAETPWARLYALSWNLGLLGVAAPALAREARTFLPGGTVGIRRRALDAIGGLDALRSHVAEDLAMSARARELGLRAALGPPVESPVGEMTRRELREKLARGHLMHLLASFRKGAAYAVGCVLIHALPWVALLAGGAARDPVLTGGALAYLVARAVVAGRFEQLSTGRFRIAWETALLDLVNLVALPLALLRRRVTWGGVTYRVGRGARLEALPT